MTVTRNEDGSLNTVVRLNNVRLAFPHLYAKQAPKGSPNATPAYSADFIVEPASDSWKGMEETILGLAQEKWPQISAEVLASIKEDRKMRCFGSGAEKRNRKTMKVMDGYEDHVYVSGRATDKAPDLYDQQGKLIDVNNALDTTSPKFYGGCYVNAAVKLWPQDNAHGRAVRGELVALQFLKDGEPFSMGRVDTTDMFKPVEGAPEPTAGSFAPEEPPVSFL